MPFLTWYLQSGAQGTPETPNCTSFNTNRDVEYLINWQYLCSLWSWWGVKDTRAHVLLDYLERKNLIKPVLCVCISASQELVVECWLEFMILVLCTEIQVICSRNAKMNQDFQTAAWASPSMYLEIWNQTWRGNMDGDWKVNSVCIVEVSFWWILLLNDSHYVPSDGTETSG